MWVDMCVVGATSALHLSVKIEDKDQFIIIPISISFERFVTYVPLMLVSLP